LTLDPVHDLQAVFRELMAAMAAPGSVRDIGSLAAKIDFEASIPRPMLAVAMALLDAETVFCVRSGSGDGREASLSRLTSARRAPIEDSDFVFVMGDGAEVALAVASARAGTLVDPHLGATLIVSAASVGEGERLSLSGPGIESRAALRIGLGAEWIAARDARNREYPLGVDMIFVDGDGRLAALPRTTVAAAGG
jgi:alpha-D-ribose 1-methylphosphonate 5-triphosphate synthase subunit PhnH